MSHCQIKAVIFHIHSFGCRKVKLKKVTLYISLIDVIFIKVLNWQIPKDWNAKLFRWNKIWKKYTSGPRYWNVPVLVNTGTFLVYQYCLKMWYLRSLERAGVIQKLTILERKNGLVLSNTRVPVSGTWSILFPL